MKNWIAIATTSAALCAGFLLGPAPGLGQAQDDKDKAKAAAKAKAIAQTFELNARVLTVFDRQGKVVKTVGPRGLYNQPVFSPDATRLAVIDTDLDKETADLWVFDVDTGARTRITASKTREQARAPVWSPDGSQVAYVALKDGSEGLYRKAASGDGAEELLYKLPGAGIVLSDWSFDGRFLNYYSVQLNESILYALPLAGDRKPIEVTRSQSQMLAARLSPDSRFLAYRSNETGKNEVFVRSFAAPNAAKDAAASTTAPAGKWQISDGGLGMVSWRRDGKELFYLAADRGVMAVEVSTAPAFEYGKPKLLFKAPDSIPVSGTPGGLANVSRDGQRVVFALPPAPNLRQITIFDRQGKVIGKVGEPGLYNQPAVSADGTRIAVSRNDLNTGNQDIWSFDVASGKANAVTNDEAPDGAPVFSADGSQIYYDSVSRDGFTSIYRKAWDGSGKAEQLFRFTPGAGLALTDVSADSKFITFSSGGIVFVVPLTGTDPLARKAIEYVRDEYDYFLGSFSPDSRYMAYLSDEIEAEKAELFVRPFDAASGGAGRQGKWRISKENANGMISWRGDGKELFFMNDDQPTGDTLVMAVDIATAPAFQPGIPHLLFKIVSNPQGGPGQWRSVTRDGQRFVFTMPVAR